MVFEFLPDTDGILSAPPAGAHSVWGKFTCTSSTDSWDWATSAGAWPDNFYLSLTEESYPETFGLEQADTAQRFSTGSSSSQTVTINSGEKVWKIVASRAKVGGGFDVFDPIGYFIADGDSLDDASLQSRWLKVDKDSSQQGIDTMFPQMPSGSFYKLVRLIPTPSSLSFQGWIGVDV